MFLNCFVRHLKIQVVFRIRMSEVIFCETDNEFLCFPFNDNPLHYMNSFPQTNFKLKWLDNKENMINK